MLSLKMAIKLRPHAMYNSDTFETPTCEILESEAKRNDNHINLPKRPLHISSIRVSVD